MNFTQGTDKLVTNTVNCKTKLPRFCMTDLQGRLGSGEWSVLLYTMQDATFVALLNNLQLSSFGGAEGNVQLNFGHFLPLSKS